MSGANTPAVVAGPTSASVVAPTVSPVQSRQVNAAVKAADNLPQLVDTLQTVAPELAAQITAAKTSVHTAPWGGAAVAGVAWLASYFGFAWGSEFDATVVALGYFAGSYAVPWIVALIQRGKSHA